MNLAEIQQHASALSGLGEDSGVWRAVQAAFAECRKDAVAAVKDFKATGEERAYHAGCLFALDEVLEQLEDLRSGAWKQWPSVKGEAEQNDE